MMADYGMAGFGHPDFVMLGITVDSGVMLIASDTLTSAEIEQRVDRIDVTAFGDGPHRREVDGLRWCELRAEMHDLHIIYAADFATAFRDLFADWTPAPRRPAVTRGKRELHR